MLPHEKDRQAILKTGHTYSLVVKVTQSHASKGSEGGLMVRL